MKRILFYQTAIGWVAIHTCFVHVAVAHEVLPEIGGGHGANASMNHATVTLSGTTLKVQLSSMVDHSGMNHGGMSATTVPVLRRLQANHYFDPDESWEVLTDKAHNFQHGWVAAGIWSPPAGAAVWIEQLEVSPGMEVYEGGRLTSEDTIRAMSFKPIFGTLDSSPRWSWDGSMTHNAYAVARPKESSFYATYRIYMGDVSTGKELLDVHGMPLYTSDETTFHFLVIPVPEPPSCWIFASALLPLVCRCRSNRF